MNNQKLVKLTDEGAKLIETIKQGINEATGMSPSYTNIIDAALKELDRSLRNQSKKNEAKMKKIEKEYRDLVKPLHLKSDEISPNNFIIGCAERFVEYLKTLTKEELAAYHGCIYKED